MLKIDLKITILFFVMVNGLSQGASELQFKNEEFTFQFEWQAWQPSLLPLCQAVSFIDLYSLLETIPTDEKITWKYYADAEIAKMVRMDYAHGLLTINSPAGNCKDMKALPPIRLVVGAKTKNVEKFVGLHFEDNPQVSWKASIFSLSIKAGQRTVVDLRKYIKSNGKALFEFSNLASSDWYVLKGNFLYFMPLKSHIGSHSIQATVDNFISRETATFDIKVQ